MIMAAVLILQARKEIQAQRSSKGGQLNISSMIPGISSLADSSESQSTWIDAGAYVNSVLK